MRWQQVLAFRLRRQALDPRWSGDPMAVVRALCGLHAQLAATPERSLRARLDDLPDGWVDRALWREGALVRTWAMRGTLHLLPADELETYLAPQLLLPERWRAASWERYHGISAAEVDRVLEALPAALGGEPLTREALAAAVAREAGDARLEAKLGDSWGAVWKLAAHRGLLVFAPPQGRLVRFTRAPRPLRMEPEPAARELATRYLRAYGPATREHFARWLGHPSAARAGRLLRLADVAEVDVDGQPMLALAADVDELRDTPPSDAVRALPAFDPYVVASPRDVAAVLDPAHKAKVHRAQGWISPVVVAGGRIVATWDDDGVHPFDAEAPPGAEAEVARLR